VACICTQWYCFDSIQYRDHFTRADHLDVLILLIFPVRTFCLYPTFKISVRLTDVVSYFPILRAISDKNGKHLGIFT
ncbi:MAG TPA: hypothetical protein PKN99_02335, partial [Cyclobacteriaceae bacterium]|nr:hypothetical protein [Cyclobacteriaceae bacterium]